MLKRAGQISVLVLLVGLLAMVVAVSLGSRSLSDLRSVTSVDAGTRGLAAAEAGLQFALNQVSLGRPTNCASPTTISGFSTLPGIKTVTYQVCAGTVDSAYQTLVPKDSVFQLDLTGMSNNTKTFAVVWSNPNAAVEIAKLDTNYALSRFSYNGSNVTDSNNFAVALPASSCVSALCAPSVSTGNCTGLGIIPHNAGDLLIRVKPLYADTDVAICGQTAGNSPGSLSLQSLVATGTATTIGGAVKKVQTSQVSGFLPAVFDNVFFSGGNIAK